MTYIAYREKAATTYLHVCLMCIFVIEKCIPLTNFAAQVFSSFLMIHFVKQLFSSSFIVFLNSRWKKYIQ